jgi:PPOX class probable F420-dependent enzyme
LTTIPESHADLLGKKGFAHVATLQPDGAPQLSVVWFDWDGELVLFSMDRKRQKMRNMGRDPRVAVIITDPESPYRVDPDPQAELADVLAHKYLGKPFDIPRPDPGRMRVTFRPEHARVYG